MSPQNKGLNNQYDVIVIGALATALMFGGLVITKAKTMGYSSAR